MSTYLNTHQQAERLVDILPPTASSPFRWLRAGMSDLLSSPITSATLGLAFTGLCVLAYTAATIAPMFSAAILVMLLLTAPYLAAAAYYVPLQREYRDKPSVSACIDGVRNRLLSVGLYAVVCALIVAAWTRLATIAFALYYGNFASGPEFARVFASGEQSASLLIFLFAASIVLAFVLFAVSAISLPLITERNTDVVTAMRTSLRALLNNKLSLGLWMALIVTLTGAAFLSNLVLMPLIFPLLAYATWHSYRQLVRNIT